MKQVILISNLFKLVRSADLAAEHAPALLPGVIRINESASFPEIREFAKESRDAVSASTEGAAVPAVDHMTESLADEKAALKELLVLCEKASGEKVDDFFKVALETVAFSLSQLVRRRAFDDADWKNVYVSPYLSPFIGQSAAEALTAELRKNWMAIDKVCHLFLPSI